MSSHPTTDISAFKNIITKFCAGDFDPDTIGLFKLAWMFAFIKDERGAKRPVVAEDALRKTAGKATPIEYRLPWKEASGRLQYGLHTPDGVNMVVLMVQESLKKNRDHCAMAVDGENALAHLVLLGGPHSDGHMEC